MKRIYLVFGIFCLTVGLGTAGANLFHRNHVKAKHHRVVHSHKFKSTEYKGVVNLNIADVKQLSSLKGIGPKKAKAIIAYRKKSGPFHSADDLSGVKGIGASFIKRLLKNNRGRVVVKRRD